MNDAEQRKYNRAGIKAAWESLDPYEAKACFDAWLEYGVHLPNSETEQYGDHILIYFAWGWRWAADRFKENWIGIPPEARGVGMEELWR